jgi:hypothetical protein
MFVFDLFNFVIGALAGSVVTVVVPKVFSTVEADVTKAEAAAKTAANNVASKL